MSAARCPRCQGCGRVLGTLGVLRWYRCRRCGVDLSRLNASGKRPDFPDSPLPSARRLVNECAGRRSVLGAAVDPAADIGHGERVVVGSRRRKP